MITIILADDHQMFREGLRTMLEQESDIEIIGEADDGLIALELVRDLSPDVVLMDIGMPNLNGIEATRQIKSISPDTKVIALSMQSADRMVIEMIKAGACGYLLKDCPFTELKSAIHTALLGRVYLSAQVADVLVKRIVAGKDNEEESPFSVLTNREREVLQLVSEGNSTKEMALLLNISVKTVDTHRQQIMNKLDIHSIAELTRYAIRTGLSPLEK